MKILKRIELNKDAVEKKSNGILRVAKYFHKVSKAFEKVKSRIRSVI